MATIEVYDGTKQTIVFAARIAGITEAELVQRMVTASSLPVQQDQPAGPGIRVYADYEGRRTHALYLPPSRVQIVDGPLQGQSFKSPTGAARAVVRHYNPNVNENRNGWIFWQIENNDGTRVWLQSIRPSAVD